MSEHSRPTEAAAEMTEHARAAEDAIQRLCRVTLARPSMTPAEVDVVLAHLAAAVSALPQAASQLGDILAQAKHDHVLAMDTLTLTEDPDLAIDTARLHLDGVREPALDVYRLLDAAREDTAHIAVADDPTRDTEDRPPAITPFVPRPETRQPSPLGRSGPVQGHGW